jgi:hypothetical protein
VVANILGNLIYPESTAIEKMMPTVNMRLPKRYVCHLGIARVWVKKANISSRCVLLFEKCFFIFFSFMKIHKQNTSIS